MSLAVALVGTAVVEAPLIFFRVAAGDILNLSQELLLLLLSQDAVPLDWVLLHNWGFSAV